MQVSISAERRKANRRRTEIISLYLSKLPWKTGEKPHKSGNLILDSKTPPMYTRLACMSMQLYLCALKKNNSNRRAPRKRRNPQEVTWNAYI